MVSHLLGAIVRHIAKGNPRLAGGLDIDTVVSHPVANNGATVRQAADARRCDGGVVPYNQRLRTAYLVREFGVAVAKVAAHLRRVANDRTFDGQV